MLRSPQTVVHVVTLLEEMPVQETLDALERAGGAAACRSARSSSTRSASRSCATRSCSPPRPARWTVAAVCAPGWPPPACPPTRTVVDGLLTEAAEHGARVALEKRR